MTPSELRDRRLALDMTQAQLAAELGAAANTVPRWERGEVSIPRHLKLAIRALADGHRVAVTVRPRRLGAKKR